MPGTCFAGAVLLVAISPEPASPRAEVPRTVDVSHQATTRIEGPAPPPSTAEVSRESSAGSEPLPERPIYLSYSVSGGPSFVINDGGAQLGGNVGAFLGFGTRQHTAFGIAGQVDMGVAFPDAVFVIHRHSLAMQGRAGKKRQFLWRTTVGAAAFHELGYGLLALGPSTAARLGWWKNRGHRKSSIFVAGEIGFDLAIWHIPIPLPFFGLCIGVGRL